MILELQRADRMRDVFDRVRLPMGEIVARIDVPRRARARMMGVQDPVEHGIAQVDVARCHVDLGTQNPRAVGKFSGPHPREQVEIFVDRPVAERAVPAGLGQRAARQPDVLLRLVIDIGLARANEVLRPGIELLEIIRRIVKVSAPIEAKPADVALDRIDVLLLLPCRIGVVKAEMATSAEFLGNAEIQADRFGVPQMQIAVRLRREPGDDAVVLSGREISRHNIAYKIPARIRSRFVSHCVPFKLRLCAKSASARQGPRCWQFAGSARPRRLGDLFRNETRPEQAPSLN